MSYGGGLSTQEQILIEQRVTNEAKSAGVAYLLWFFTGSMGGHRFYLGRTGSGATMLILFLISWPLMLVAIGFLTITAVGIWALVDAFLIPGMIADHRNDVRNKLTMTALSYQRPAPGLSDDRREPAMIAER